MCCPKTTFLQKKYFFYHRPSAKRYIKINLFGFSFLRGTEPSYFNNVYKNTKSNLHIFFANELKSVEFCSNWVHIYEVQAPVRFSTFVKNPKSIKVFLTKQLAAPRPPPRNPVFSINSENAYTSQNAEYSVQMRPLHRKP